MDIVLRGGRVIDTSAESIVDRTTDILIRNRARQVGSVRVHPIGAISRSLESAEITSADKGLLA